MRSAILALAAVALGSFTAGAQPATLSFEVVDRAGRSLVSAFTVLDLNGKRIAGSKDGKPVALEAGTYVVEAANDTSISTDIDVAAGTTVVARAALEDALWLDVHLQPKAPQRIELFRAPVVAEAHTMLRAGAGGHAWQARIARRAGATQDDVDRGLEAARRLLGLRLTNPRGGTPQERARFGVWQTAVYGWALPALASAGTAADVALIKRSFEHPEIPGFDRAPTLVFIAYLERRLGLLERGEIAALAEDKSPLGASATFLLAYYGVPGSTQKLLAVIDDHARFDALGSNRRNEIAALVAARSPDAFPAIASALLKRAVARARAGDGQRDALARDTTVAATAHLLLFGSAADRRILTDETMRAPAFETRWNIVPLLTRLSADPAVLGAEIVGDAENRDRVMALACGYQRLRGKSAFGFGANRIIAAFAEAAEAKKAYVLPKGEAYGAADRTRRIMLGGCRPDEAIASAYYHNKLDPEKHGSPGDWYPGFKSIEALRKFMQQHAFLSDPVKASPAGLVLDAWPQLTAPAWTDFRDERMALFRAFTKTGDDWVNGTVEDGIERRVYLMRAVPKNKEHSGAISGHVEVRPHAVDGMLAIALRLNQAAYYRQDGIATAMATNGNPARWIHHSYVVDAGRKLIERLALVRGAETLPLKLERTDADGTFHYSTGVTAGELANLVLEIDLAMFDERRSFAVDLFASGFARGRQPSK